MKIETLKNLIRVFILFLIAVVAAIVVIKVETIQPGLLSLFVMLVFVMIAATVDFFLKECLCEKIILQFIKANETRIVQKGWGNLICWHRYKLSNSSEEMLVRLARTSEKHRKILLNYDKGLCSGAASIFVYDGILFGYLEEFLLNNGYQENILSILIDNSTEKKYGDLLRTYLKKDRWGYVYLSHGDFVKRLIDNGQAEILVGYCQEVKYMKPTDEVTLVKLAPRDAAFRSILKKYLEAIKNDNCRYRRTENSVSCSVKGGLWQNNISKEAEEELVSNGSYDIIKLYCKYVKNLYTESVFLLAKRYQLGQEDGEIKDILLQQKLVVNNEQLVIKDILGIFTGLMAN